jgi:hypothetical protein
MPTGGKGSSGGGGGKAGSGDIRAGGAFVELFARDNLTKVLDKLKSRVAAAGKTFQEAGKKGALAGAAILAPITALFVGGVNRVADTGRMARQFQIPIELMGRLQYAAEAAGVSVEEVMNDTQGRFRDLLAKAPVVDPGRAQQALKTQEAFRDATRALQDALLPLLDIVTPIVQAFSEFIKRNASGVTVIAAVGAAILAASTALTALGTVLTVATAGAAALAGVVSAILSPLGLVTAGVAALTAVFLTNTEVGQQMAADLGESFREMGATFEEAWSGIAAAVKTGNLELAFRIVGAGIKSIWAQVILTLKKGWNDFMGWTVDALRANPWILPLIGGIVGGVTGGPVGAIAGAAGGAVGAGLLEAFADKVKDTLAADLSGSAAAVADAQRELSALVNVARGGAAGRLAGPAGPDPMRGDQLFRRAAAASFEAVRGGFGAGLGRQQFGLGDQVKVQTELQKQIKDNTALTAANVAAILVALRLN